MKTIKRYTPNIELEMMQVVPDGDWLSIEDVLRLIYEVEKYTFTKEEFYKELKKRIN